FVNQPNSKILRNGHDSPSKKGIESQTPIQSKIKKQNVDSEDPGNALVSISGADRCPRPLVRVATPVTLPPAQMAVV
ncbi:MAG: hypothetical protein QF384_21680, partial [Alphaproteobacteria bacterium]|nr:hypothetical protein [Alphaproteobacteria bacterium]